MKWFYPNGELSSSGAEVVITPELAGWDYSGLKVFDLSNQNSIDLDLEHEEAIILPLSAQAVSVTVNGESFHLVGRVGVFHSVSDHIYVPVGSKVTISGVNGEIAICTARATETFPVVYTSAESVEVEVRGAGRASRQVTNIATPTSFAGAHRINVCEVITPGGNLSSWPPHRHDGIGDCKFSNEEIYYFRIGRTDSYHGTLDGQGSFHVYTFDGSKDETVTLHDGDVYLVPEGYHGPSTAPPEYPMYFLNILAGPGEDRTMAFCDDPEHEYIRKSWLSQEQDPRLPWTTSEGPNKTRREV
jgi:5-deoxy-glucuronate isomerase